MIARKVGYWRRHPAVKGAIALLISLNVLCLLALGAAWPALRTSCLARTALAKGSPMKVSTRSYHQAALLHLVRGPSRSLCSLGEHATCESVVFIRTHGARATRASCLVSMRTWKRRG
jgi:hypothetical protein